jgi:hypothetical protein
LHRGAFGLNDCQGTRLPKLVFQIVELRPHRLLPQVRFTWALSFQSMIAGVFF